MNYQAGKVEFALGTTPVAKLPAGKVDGDTLDALITSMRSCEIRGRSITVLNNCRMSAVESFRAGKQEVR